MPNTVDSQTLISHAASAQSIEHVIQKTTARIQQQGDKPYVTVQRQLELLHQLTEFDFGQFLLKNQGINGYWTDYMLTHPWFGRKTGKNNAGKPFTELEDFILNRAPLMLATQQRFEIFLIENQQCVQNNATLACIPCGMMGELLYLNFTAVSDIQLVGIDYDPVALQDAHVLAEKKHLSQFIQLDKGDAWQLPFIEKFDLISSNGLNIYEPDKEKVTELYRGFHKALKPGGKLVTSFLTCSPMFTQQCEWNMSRINQADLLLQKIIFADIVEAKFYACQSSWQKQQQLESVGYRDIKMIYDEAKMFPTVIAYKG